MLQVSDSLKSELAAAIVERDDAKQDLENTKRQFRQESRETQQVQISSRLFYLRTYIWPILNWGTWNTQLAVLICQNSVVPDSLYVTRLKSLWNFGLHIELLHGYRP